MQSNSSSNLCISPLLLSAPPSFWAEQVWGLFGVHMHSATGHSALPNTASWGREKPGYNHLTLRQKQIAFLSFSPGFPEAGQQVQKL